MNPSFPNFISPNLISDVALYLPCALEDPNSSSFRIGKYIVPGDHYRSPNIIVYQCVTHFFSNLQSISVSSMSELSGRVHSIAWWRHGHVSVCRCLETLSTRMAKHHLSKFKGQLGNTTQDFPYGYVGIRVHPTIPWKMALSNMLLGYWDDLIALLKAAILTFQKLLHMPHMPLNCQTNLSQKSRTQSGAWRFNGKVQIPLGSSQAPKITTNVETTYLEHLASS